MNIFGIAKGGIYRAVTNFSSPPDLQPHTVCFHFPQKVISHIYVLKCLEEQLRGVPGWDVVTIRFLDRNVQLGCLGVENRWIIKCKNEITAETLVKKGIMLCNKKIAVCYHDEIIAGEYKQYIDYMQHRNKLFSEPKKTPIGKRGDERGRQDDRVVRINTQVAVMSSSGSASDNTTDGED